MGKKKLGKCDVDMLTEREIEIMQMLAAGIENKEIAERLFISYYTVKYHLKVLFQKTGYSNAVSLVAHAVAARVVEISDR